MFLFFVGVAGSRMYSGSWGGVGIPPGCLLRFWALRAGFVVVCLGAWLSAGGTLCVVLNEATGEGAVMEATIALFEGDKAKLRDISEEYQQDAEEFWKTATSIVTPEEESDEEEAGGAEAAAGADGAASALNRKKLQRTKVWKWLLITYHFLWCVLGVG